jgi:N-acetylmuramoyl-L-alanine amidase
LLIYLDAGHGGKDSGAIGNGLKEKDIVLDIVKLIEEGLKAFDVKTLLSRETDIFLSLDERTSKANAAKADLFLSVHVNSAVNTTARGFESYIYPNSGAATSALQNVMHQEIVRAIQGAAGFDDRGKKQANFAVLRQSAMKALLTENMFISNAADAALLKNDDFKQKVAQGHINGLEKYLGLKRLERPPEKAPTTGKLWRVQVGAFEEKENAEALAKDLNKSGYRAFIKYE